MLIRLQTIPLIGYAIILLIILILIGVFTMALRASKSNGRTAKVEVMTHNEATDRYEDFNKRDINAIMSYVKNPKLRGRGTSYARFEAYSKASTLIEFMTVCDDDSLFHNGFDGKGKADLIHDIQFGFITMTEPLKPEPKSELKSKSEMKPESKK